MHDAESLVTQYLEAFNETDADRRRGLLEALYAPDCTYTDPRVDLQGADQIDEFIEQTQARFPGFRFRLAGPVDSHHEQARFSWQAGPVAAPDDYVGFDVIVLEEGRIRSVYGFMDAAPAA